MILRLLMAAVRKGPSGVLERVPSAGSRNKPIGAPLRAIHPNSSPIYKTQSDSALSSRLEKLSINDKKNNLLPKRASSNSTGANGLVKNLADAARLLQQETVKNVVVVAGAGISTPSGIPDFRSPGTGLYDNLQQYNIPYPEAIFDIDYFFVSPRPFFTLAKELYPSGKYRPNYIHYFVRQLYDKGLLLRMYTQNIDGLERLAGVPAEKLVEAHGTFATATCTTCRQKMEGSEIKDKIFSDKLPRCPTRGCMGIVKPDIVFFGEDLPRKFYSYMKDMLQADLVLVMGTSLEVQPFAGIIDTVRYNVPRVLFNREAVGPFKFNRRTQDIVAAGDLVDNMVKFATQIGWKEDMVELITKQEGQFVIETRKRLPPTGPPKPKPGPVKQLNKSPPKTTQARVNNNNRGFARQRPTFNLYDSDSSSAESTESDSDFTSSDSSEEENKKSKFKGVNRGKILNNSIRNGATQNNFVRSTSAKIIGTNSKRDLHTQRTLKSGKFSPAESLTGRSVKSESAMNSTLVKSRQENCKNVTPISDTKPKAKVESVIPQSKSETPVVAEKNKVQQAERAKVLRKYGLGSQPSLNNITKVPKSVNSPISNGKAPINGAKTSSEKVTSAENKDRPLKAVKSDSAIACTGYFYDNLNSNKEIKTNAFEATAFETTTESLKDMEKQSTNEQERLEEVDEYITNEIEQFRSQRNAKHIETVDLKANLKAGETKSLNTEIPVENIESYPVVNKVEGAMNIDRNEVAKEISGNKSNGTKDVMVEPVVSKTEDKKSLENPKMTEHNAWKKESSARDKVLQLLDQKRPYDIEVGSCAASLNGRSRSLSERGSKVLSEKAALSFQKYAKVASSKKNGEKKHGKKKRRGSKNKKDRDRPSPGGKSLVSKSPLKNVNALPYGYAHKQASTVKGVGPFNRTNIRTLSSAMERTNLDLTRRSGSADLPKISYRHQTHPSPNNNSPGIRMLGTQSTLLVSPDNFSEDSR